MRCIRKGFAVLALVGVLGTGYAQEEPAEEPAAEPGEVVLSTGLTEEQYSNAIKSILLTLVVALGFRIILKQIR